MASFERVLPTERIFNFRDYGGYQTLDGRRLPIGHLYRSGDLSQANSADLTCLDGIGLEAVIDLRTNRERELWPSRQGARPIPRIAFASSNDGDLPPHLAAAEQGSSVEAVQRWLTKGYERAPFESTIVAALRVYFDALIETDGPSLVHCMVGKDRTGMAVALLHEAVGVRRDEAIADFLLTNTAGDQSVRMAALAPTVRQFCGAAVSDAVMRAVLSVEPVYFEAMHSGIVGVAGDLTRYFETVLGVDSRRMELLRTRLLCECG